MSEGAFKMRLSGRVEIMDLTLSKNFTIYNRFQCGAASFTPPSSMQNIEYVLSPDSVLSLY